MATSVTLKPNAIDISGSTSGTATLQAPAVAGTTTITLPSTTGTLMLTTGTATTATNLAGGSNGTIPYQSASGTTQMLAVGTSGQLLQTNGAGAPSWVNAPTQTYPSSGIANSTGSAWGTSYTTSGSGTVVALNNTPTLTNPTVTNYTETLYTANTGTAITVSLTNGTVQQLTLTGNATITMPSASAGKSFIIMLKQDGTGSRTVTWSTVTWPSGTAPTITSTASKQDIFSFFSDGTNWYGATIGQNY